MDFLEVSKWCNPRSLLVITELGKMKLINCPFIVICINAVGDLTEFRLYNVDAVKMTKQGKIVYEILGASYYHYAFKIIDQ